MGILLCGNNTFIAEANSGSSATEDATAYLMRHIKIVTNWEIYSKNKEQEHWKKKKPLDAKSRNKCFE